MSLPLEKDLRHGPGGQLCHEVTSAFQPGERGTNVSLWTIAEDLVVAGGGLLDEAEEP
jgi:hypothetical protein